MDRSRVAPELRHMVRGHPFELLEYRWARKLARILAKVVPPARIEGVTIKAIKGTPRLRLYRPAMLRTDAALL